MFDGGVFLIFSPNSIANQYGKIPILTDIKAILWNMQMWIHLDHLINREKIGLRKDFNNKIRDLIVRKFCYIIKDNIKDKKCK